MDWPSWDQSLIAALLSGVTALLLQSGRLDDARLAKARFAEPALLEFSSLAGLYSLWRIARQLPLTQSNGAIERARQIVELQNLLRFPTELWLQKFALQYEWLGWFTTLYYALMHVPTLIAFILWLFWRHRDSYSRWRNALVVLTGLSLFIRFIRVAPPRFLVDLGYLDLSEIYGPSVYGPVGTGVSDQFAAMPSIHVGWAAVVSFGVVAASKSPWRWLFLSHVIITFLVVSATGNHWWLDGIVSFVLLGIGLACDPVVKHLTAKLSSQEAELAL